MVWLTGLSEEEGKKDIFCHEHTNHLPACLTSGVGGISWTGEASISGVGGGGASISGILSAGASIAGAGAGAGISAGSDGNGITEGELPLVLLLTPSLFSGWISSSFRYSILHLQFLIFKNT